MEVQMLTSGLQSSWDQASETERIRARGLAEHTLQMLVHYKKGANHQAEDLELLAATFIYYEDHRGQRHVRMP